MFDILENPDANIIGRSPDEFLDVLQNPTLIKVTGKDTSRTRALATLLHGNEPSGFLAIHRWLLEGQQPTTNVLFIIGNVAAAKLAPRFTQRQLPEGRDLNRCFNAPFDGKEGQIAFSLLTHLHEIHPESLVDMHNTSGTGPAFGVTIRYDETHIALTSLFTDRLMVTGLRLGALMEFSEREVPTVTIEVGGAQDQHAHDLAYEALSRYVSVNDVFAKPDTDWDLDVLREPVRVELKPEIKLAYHETPQMGADLTLRPDIEHLNFGVIDESTQLGWVGPRGMDCFSVLNNNQEQIREKVLRIEEGGLYPAQGLKAFMITSNPTIAKSDCLCYVVTDQGEEIC